MSTRLDPELIAAPSDSLRSAMEQLNRNQHGIVLVLDASQGLLFTVTDGDLRRAILRGVGMDVALEEWARTMPEKGNRSPLSAPVDAPRATRLRIMREAGVRHLPLIDGSGRVVGLTRLEDLVDVPPGVQAVVMAGGFGKRLRELTRDMPKPMLPVGDRPALEKIVEHLRSCGIRDLAFTTHFKPEKIHEHFGDGAKFGVNINYVHEDEPLGTAGALGLMEPPAVTQLVVNGDILTGVNYRAMLDFHRESKALMTVGVRHFELQVPYGVVESEGERVTALTEKPTMRFYVSAGVYLIEPAVYRYLKRDERVDMPDLVRRLLDESARVVSYPISEYWIDIGAPQDYERVQQDAALGRI